MLKLELITEFLRGVLYAVKELKIILRFVIVLLLELLCGFSLLSQLRHCISKRRQNPEDRSKDVLLGGVAELLQHQALVDEAIRVEIALLLRTEVMLDHDVSTVVQVLK